MRFVPNHINSKRTLGFKTALSIVYCLTSIVSFAQTNTEVFGQNRVQYKDFTFQYYESDNFTTYFYMGGQDVAKYVIKTAEDVSDDISTLLDYKFRKKIDIIVYNNINELNQTNIGIYESGQSPGGNIKIPDNKIFIYYNGDHRHLDKQIRESLAKIYTINLFKGASFGEVIQNSVLLNLPDWYKSGLIQYIGENWNSDMEDRLRDGILTGRYKRLNKLQPEEAIFVGHSIWHYIEEVHGKTALSNVIYLTRVNRSVDNGFLFVLGTNLSQTLQDWYTYYFNRFNNEKSVTSFLPDSNIVKARIKKNIDYYDARLCPDGKHIAYASNDMGRYKVYITNTVDNKTKVIFRGGYRTNTQFTDESVPLLAWDPSGKRLAIISDKRSLIFLRFYDLEKDKMEVNPIRKFQKVVSFSFVDSKQLVMSAVQNGQTDVFLYTIAGTTTRKITDDYFDDLDPAYIATGDMRGIMFSSNRPDDTLRPSRYESQNILKTHDLFFYDLNTNSNVLYRITNTPFINETYPQNFGDKEFSFLSDETGIRNRYIGHLENVFDHNSKTYRFVNKETDELDSITIGENIPFDSVMDRSTVLMKDSSVRKVYKTGGVTTSYTNYPYSIREQNVVPEKNLALDVFLRNNRPRFYKYSLGSTANANAPMTEYMVNLQRRMIQGDKKEEAKNPEKEKKEEEKPVAKYDSLQANKGNRPNDFQSEFDYGIKLFDWDSASASKLNAAQEGYVFRFSKIRPYFVRFMIDKVIANLDNNILMTRYEPFDASNPMYNTPSPISFTLKFGITDLLENYKLYLGVRLPLSGPIINNLEYFIVYENLKKRLDKKFSFYRKSVESTAFDKLPFSNTPIPTNSSVDYSIKTNYLELELKYAIDVLSRLNFAIAFRNDKVVFKAKDDFSLKLPSSSDNWLFFRTEYVFDNCIEVAPNIRYGTRFKVFGEFHKEFPAPNKNISDKIDLPVPQFNNKYLTVFGFDLRHYLKVYKHIIWANRLAAGASFGNSKLIYYLGGLENWFTKSPGDKFDHNTPINVNNNYAFQTIATPLRGFKQNARNGDKYVVLNSELRVPVFATLINSPIRSEFIRNFQLVLFCDAGTAWEGPSPFSSKNPLFNEEIPNASENPSVIVRVKKYKTPVIMGFGPGLRTSLLGFFLRFDAAWGYDTGELSKKPMYYFTFGLDF